MPSRLRRAASYPAAAGAGNRGNADGTVTEGPPEAAPASGLARWFRENSADTRHPDGPEPRLYETPFSDVWDELLRYVDRRWWWRLAHRDENLGLMSVRCVFPILRFVDDLTIWVALDANGLTRVEAFSRARRRDFDLGANRRRIRRMLRSVDRALGPAARLPSGAE
ncbi:DUF1499 domain-containing protein [Candidatus Palauibacter sp.]|uniref:DUF1499 domain-containing protein n=1 Tax=Candidatus Palauibacter sp. TaxID=3101350 RepID=UPI003B5AEF4C